jgi:hypothetical protein
MFVDVFAAYSSVRSLLFFLRVAIVLGSSFPTSKRNGLVAKLLDQQQLAARETEETQPLRLRLAKV